MCIRLENICLDFYVLKLFILKHLNVNRKLRLPTVKWKKHVLPVSKQKPM